MLLRKVGIRTPSRRYEPVITVDSDSKERMREHVRGLGIADGEKFVVVHPGMGGSALNWPEGYYVDLVARLAGRGVPVIVTGGMPEAPLVKRVVEAAREQAAVAALKKKTPAPAGGPATLPLHQFLGPNSPGGLSDFTGLLSLATVVVAPSTGPLHIAAALGKKTVSFYAPVKVQSALRWGPYSAKEGRHSVLVPDALCGQDYKCAGRKCRFYFCMERLGVDEALDAVIAQLEEKT
jgi:ADP-heptose:LPS heptosyltransferase